MKKFLLLLCSSLAALTSFSQATVSNLGMSGNMFTSAFGVKTYLWADPNLNCIVFMHRGGTPTGDSNTGYLRYDISKDGGITWTNNVGPVYLNPTNYNAARYPQVVIYNPPLNTIADSAFVAFYAPCSNPNWWNSQVYGRSQIGGTMSSVQRTDTFNAGFLGLVPEEFFVTQQGTAWISDMSADSLNAEFRDTLYLGKGTWNVITKDFDYSRSRLYVPLNPRPINFNMSGRAYGDHRLAFAPNGVTGYIAVLGHNTSYSSIDSSYYPIIYKTTNGGLTWGAPMNVPLSAVGPLLGITAPTYTTGTELDMVVDMNGNPHIITTVGKANGSWGMDTTYGAWGVIDLWSPNGGTTWNMTLLHKPHRQRMMYPSPSSIEEFTRPQASINWAGDKVFFTWFVTDTVLNNAPGNSMPDAFMKGFDIVSGLWTDSMNMSAGITNASGAMHFGVASYYVLTPNGNEYEVPVAFSQPTFPSDMFQPGQIKYLGNFLVNNADFNKIGYTVTVGLKDFDYQQLLVTQNYPNPFDNVTSFDLHLEKSCDVKIMITNIIGETVMPGSAKTYSQGTHAIHLDVQNLSPGIYFYTVSTPEMSVTRKMIKE